MRSSLLQSLVFALANATWTPALADGIPESRISVPISIELSGLEALVERSLPVTLHRKEYGRTCVEPERVCTKVPEFRGFEVTMKNRCAEVSPRIDCTVTESVVREDPIGISGNGHQLVVQQTIYGSGTVRGRGEVGRHIRQTVRARAEMTVLANPTITPDWRPNVPLSITYRWLERPEFRLFNLIPVTLGSTLGPPLDKALRDFERNGINQELEKLNVRSEAEALWLAVQAPIELPLPGGEKLFLHLRPYGVGVAEPRFDDGALRTRLDLALRAVVTDENEASETVPLPNLSDLPNSGLSVNVPVRVTTQSLNAAVSKQLPATIPIEGEGDGTRFVVYEAVTAIGDDTLTVDAIVDAEGGPLSLERESIRITATPYIDEETHTLTFSEISLASGDQGLAGMAKTLMLKAATTFMAEQYSIALSEEILALEKALDDAINRPLSPDFAMSGSGHMRARNFRLLTDESAVQVTLTSTGEVQISGFDPTRAQQ